MGFRIILVAKLYQIACLLVHFSLSVRILLDNIYVYAYTVLDLNVHTNTDYQAVSVCMFIYRSDQIRTTYCTAIQRVMFSFECCGSFQRDR